VTEIEVCGEGKERKQVGGRKLSSIWDIFEDWIDCGIVVEKCPGGQSASLVWRFGGCICHGS
jgi:hypothetical protein